MFLCLYIGVAGVRSKLEKLASIFTNWTRCTIKTKLTIDNLKHSQIRMTYYKSLLLLIRHVISREGYQLTQLGREFILTRWISVVILFFQDLM